MEVDTDVHWMHGRVTDGHGAVLSFSSWVALLAALQTLRAEAPSPPQERAP